MEKQKIENPDVEYAYPSNWGPFECLWTASKGLRAFREKYAGRVPLEGLQANQMLRVRPSAESGHLELVSAAEAWSFSTAPGRGIRPRMATKRDETVAEWPSSVPPIPDWTVLDGKVLTSDALPDQPDDEADCIEFSVPRLELTDEQVAMLVPASERIRQLTFEGSVQRRVALGKKRGWKRKNKWGAKFHGHFLGKAQAKWRKRLDQGERASLVKESEGLAKGPKALKFMQSIRDKVKANDAARKKEALAEKALADKGQTEDPTSEWLKRAVVVVAEDSPHLGRAGTVARVFKVEGGSLELHIFEHVSASGKVPRPTRTMILVI